MIPRVGEFVDERPLPFEVGCERSPIRDADGDEPVIGVALEATGMSTTGFPVAVEGDLDVRKFETDDREPMSSPLHQLLLRRTERLDRPSRRWRRIRGGCSMDTGANEEVIGLDESPHWEVEGAPEGDRWDEQTADRGHEDEEVAHARTVRAKRAASVASVVTATSWVRAVRLSDGDP